jgi:hypothetical protein
MQHVEYVQERSFDAVSRMTIRTAEKYSNRCGSDRTGVHALGRDLRGRTAVDVLPADGMQEVRRSNPLSSTQVKEMNSKS